MKRVCPNNEREFCTKPSVLSCEKLIISYHSAENINSPQLKFCVLAQKRAHVHNHTYTHTHTHTQPPTYPPNHSPTHTQFRFIPGWNSGRELTNMCSVALFSPYTDVIRKQIAFSLVALVTMIIISRQSEQQSQLSFIISASASVSSAL
jgi:hypothetical protein